MLYEVKDTYLRYAVCSECETVKGRRHVSGQRTQGTSSCRLMTTCNYSPTSHIHALGHTYPQTRIDSYIACAY